MSSARASSGVVKIDVSGSDLAVGELKSYTMDESADSIEKSVMGDISRKYEPGMESTTVTIEAYFDAGDAAQNQMTARQPIDFEIHPEGTATGRRVFTGSGHVTSRSVSAAFDGMIEISFTIQCTGQVVGGLN